MHTYYEPDSIPGTRVASVNNVDIVPTRLEQVNRIMLSAIQREQGYERRGAASCGSVP